MSTIYSDAAGNKYLGDCRWGNHDINYPTTNYLKCIDDRTINSTFLSDCLSIFADMGYGNIQVPESWPTTSGDNIFSFTPAGESSGNYFALKRGNNNVSYEDLIYATSSIVSDYTGKTESGIGQFNFDYALCCGTASIAFKPFLYEVGYSNAGIGKFNQQRFFYAGKLQNINTNFSYYNSSFTTQCIVLSTESNTNSISVDVVGYHYIVNAKKALLESGRATYAISCSDGQTPGAQWATDMWVYDNNAALGYPVIGRVPNMLLGIGTYTYLKPVKIQGSVFPDGGSPWYLPVGTFSGKVLLMRCYSSVS